MNKTWRNSLMGGCLIGCAAGWIGCDRSGALESKPLSMSTGQGKKPVHSTAAFELRDSHDLSQCSYSNGREGNANAILEIVGGGVGCFDYDLDGLVDIVVPRGGTIDPTREIVGGVNSELLKSGGEWRFSMVTEAARIDTSRIYSHGVSVADFDQDGFDDILIYGYGGVSLCRNMGDGTFTDVALLMGLASAPWTTAAAWLDLDNDQCLDLYLGSYVDWSFENNQVCYSPTGEPSVCSPNRYQGSRNKSYRNSGDGRFELMDEPKTAQLGKTLGLLAAEFGLRQGVSLYVANDLIANFFFTRSEDAFVETAFASGVAVDDSGVANGSMGVALLDFNGDHRFDIFVTNFAHEKMALYENIDGRSFQHASRRVGLNRGDLAVVGFGVVAADFDGDADEDIVYTAGHVYYQPDNDTIEQLPGFLQNEAGVKFSKPDLPCQFFVTPRVGRGLATADFDGDGDLDLVASQLMGPPVLVENTQVNGGGWLSVKLVGTAGPRTPIGATVKLDVAVDPERKLSLLRQQVGGGSYLSQSQSHLFFAWPRQALATADQPSLVTLSVSWPDGSQSEPIEVESNQHVVLVQSSKGN